MKLFFQSVWNYIKVIGKWMVRYPLAIAATVLLVVGSILLLAFGKNVQLGGILGKLFGKENNTNARGVPPPGRTDENGKVIQPGESDEKGFVQAPALKAIKDPGLFDNPNVLVIEHPEKGEVRIELPKGVKNSDVKEVIEIEPDVYEIRNNDSGVDYDDILDSLGEK